MRAISYPAARIDGMWIMHGEFKASSCMQVCHSISESESVTDMSVICTRAVLQPGGVAFYGSRELQALLS